MNEYESVPLLQLAAWKRNYVGRRVAIRGFVHDLVTPNNGKEFQFFEGELRSKDSRRVVQFVGSNAPPLHPKILGDSQRLSLEVEVQGTVIKTLLRANEAYAVQVEGVFPQTYSESA